MKSLRYLVAVAAGAAYGLLFAQKPGKKFREELKKSDTPVKTFFNECKEVDMEAFQVISECVKESEDLQRIFEVGKTQFAEAKNKARQMGAEGKEALIAKLEELAHDAEETAKEIKNSLEEKSEEVSENVKTGMKTVARKIKE